MLDEALDLVTVGISGGWGSDKITVLRLVEDGFAPQAPDGDTNGARDQYGPVALRSRGRCRGGPDRGVLSAVAVELVKAEKSGWVRSCAWADGANTGLGFPVDFTVQVSADDDAWTSVAGRKDCLRSAVSAQSFAFPAVDVRYVRVIGTKLRIDPHGNHHMQLAEIETVGGNLAVNRPVRSSSSLESAGWRRAAATDGVLNSALGYSMGWTSAKSPTATANEWLAVDLQSADVISQVQLVPRTDGANTGLGFPVDFTVQVSADNAAWTTVASRTGRPRPGAAARPSPSPRPRPGTSGSSPPG